MFLQQTVNIYLHLTFKKKYSTLRNTKTTMTSLISFQRQSERICLEK